MININRRELRGKLGSRRSRREGTKSKGISTAKTTGRGKAGRPTRIQCFRSPQRQRPRPAVLLNALIRKAQEQQAAA